MHIQIQTRNRHSLVANKAPYVPKSQDHESKNASGATNYNSRENVLNRIKSGVVAQRQSIVASRKIHARNTAPKWMKHRTVQQRMEDGEFDICINLNNIALILIENGATYVGGELFADYRQLQEYEMLMHKNSKSMLHQICPKRDDPDDTMTKTKSTVNQQNVNNCDLHDEKQVECNVSSNININIRNKMLLEPIQQTRNAFINFITKYLINSERELAGSLKDSSIEQLESYFKKNGIEAQPWPKNKEILLKVYHQYEVLQDKVHSQWLMEFNGKSIYTSVHECQMDKRKMNKVAEELINHYKCQRIYRETKYRSCTGYQNSSLDSRLYIDSIINAQFLLEKNIDLCKLDNWQNSAHDSSKLLNLRNIFGQYESMRRLCSMANISSDEYSYYMQCQAELERVAPNWNCSKTRRVYLNKRHAETDKKLQDKWNEMKENCNNKSQKCVAFDFVNQIFGEIVRNIDNSGLCSLLSKYSDKEKIECINKLAPTLIVFAETGDKTAFLLQII